MTVLLNIVDNAVNEVEFLRLIRSTAVTIIYSVYHNNYDSYTRVIYFPNTRNSVSVPRYGVTCPERLPPSGHASNTRRNLYIFFI